MTNVGLRPECPPLDAAEMPLGQTRRSRMSIGRVASSGAQQTIRGVIAAQEDSLGDEMERSGGDRSATHQRSGDERTSAHAI